MKKLFYGIMTLAILGVSLVSCSDDDDEGYILRQGVGDIMPNDGGRTIRILLDDADTVLITNSEKFDFQPETRVSFAGEIISERKSGTQTFYEFRAVVMDSVLTKKPLLQTELDADQVLADSVGTDNIHLLTAEVAAKYLNVNYTLWHGGTGQKHFINLVIDDLPKVNPLIVNEEGVLVLESELRHNAFGDSPRYESYGFVSFKIQDYLSIPGLKKIVFNIKYGSGRKTVEYKLPETIENSDKTLLKSKAFSTRFFSESF